jgi:hypothetical protein
VMTALHYEERHRVSFGCCLGDGTCLQCLKGGCVEPHQFVPVAVHPKGFFPGCRCTCMPSVHASVQGQLAATLFKLQFTSSGTAPALHHVRMPWMGVLGAILLWVPWPTRIQSLLWLQHHAFSVS